MENKKVSCSCSDNSEMVVLACSGACDLGEITDKVARKLRDKDIRNMKCLAMVAADSKPLIDSLKIANVMVLDGCAVDCGKKIMEKAKIPNFNYIRLTDLGFVKGQTPATEETINKIFDDIKNVC